MDSIRKTIEEMMIDRGFVVNGDIATRDQETIYIRILDSKKIGKREIITLIQEMEEEGHQHLIIIIPQKLTPLAIQELKNTDKEIEVFIYKELMFNITRHYTQPKMKILNKEEKYSLIQQIKQSQLPIILRTDPICRYYNAKPGDIFEFKRPSIYYRIVV